MKRRAISFITVLALCLSLCPTLALAGGILTQYSLTQDTSKQTSLIADEPLRFDTCGYTFTVTDEAAVIVKGTGQLHLTTGTIQSENGAGIKVLAGELYVEETDMTVIGTTYGLDIASGTTVKLSGGTFTGGTAAIHLQDTDGNYDALLASDAAARYAYFDENGNPVALADVGGETTVTVKECTEHKYAYRANDGKPTHNGTCIYCGAEVGPLFCTFDFDGDGHGVCADNCGHTLDVTITINETDLVYNGEGRPDSANIVVTVTLNGDGDTPLDYMMDYTPHVNADEFVTVTVTIGDDNGTYQKTFDITQAQPEITWAENSVTVVYDGSPVEETELPEVKIIPVHDDDLGELQSLLRIFYKELGADDDSYKEGLPTDVGTYTIRASTPATTNYKEASAEITLTIKKINSIKDAPEALELTYNGTAQKLVSSGTVNSGAVGAVIQFATSESGPWSTDIPTGTNAGVYEVWYKVDGTGNYDGVGPRQISGVEIQRKQITPIVELEYDTVVYDGGFKEPKVTVRDPDTRAELPGSEYGVTYRANQYVGTARVIVSDKDDGNYTILPSEGQITGDPEGFVVTFQITPADQNALTITGQRDTVAYGDVFTLGTVGGSGNGTVTWEIVSPAPTSGDNDTESVTATAKINKKSGQVTVTGIGTITVRATKSGTDSDGEKHTTATAEWTFTVVPKRVTATVTAKDKIYNGTNTAEVTAEVPTQDIVSGDTITITELTGTFNDANVGTGKTVTVDKNNAVVMLNGVKLTGTTGEKYIVTVPTAPVRADITKAETSIKDKERPTGKSLTYNGTKQALVEEGKAYLNGTSVEVPLEYALSADGPYSAYIPQAADAGSYEVWYRVPETNNYYGTTAAKVEVTISPKSVTPDVTLPSDTEYNYVYDGTEKKPAVTVSYKEGGQTKEIPASEYTVTYSNNVNVGEATGNNPPTVTVTDNAGGNYKFDPVTEHFNITSGGSAVLTSSPQANDLTYNGQPQNLVSVGTASGGSLVYSLGDENNYQDTIPTGTEAGQYTVYYKVKGDSNHTDSVSFHVYVTIRPKTVTSPFIELPANKTFTYDGSEQKFADNEIIVKDGSKTIPTGEYTVTYSNNINAGTATVHIVDNSGGNYDVSGSTIFTIAKADVNVTNVSAPTAIDGLTYNGGAHGLIARGYSPDGTMLYKLGENGNYSEDIPTAVAAGNYKVYYRVRGDSNHTDYEASNPVEVTIEKAEQNAFWIDGKPSGTIYYNDQFALSTIGGSGSGTVTWTSSDEGIATVTDGFVEVIGVGKVTITATKYADTNYNEASAAWTFTVSQAAAALATPPELVQTPLTYTGGELSLLINGAATVNGIGTVKYSTDKENWSENNLVVINAGTYTVWYMVEDDAGGNWKGIAPMLLGTVTIDPKTVRIQSVTYNLATNTPTVTFADGDTIPDNCFKATRINADGPGLENEVTVSVELLDNNYIFEDGTMTQTHTATIVIENTPQAPSGGNSGTGGTTSAPTTPSESASIQTSERDGTASTVVNDAAGDELVNEAVANQSEAVIIRPEITSDVTKTEVSLPASAVSRLGSETDAALTVSTPVADVTIPNEALETLSGAGGMVGVVTERVENTVVLTLTADGQELGDIPGGLTLTVPMENAGPGTVAVVVREDGTRETVRWSVAADGAVRIPLNGSVTVELVDNGKEFSDVSSGSWASDAVAFTSAREIFSGTGETTFSPNLVMSRAMLATMLYNLEGRPEQELTNGFDDVSSDAWYAAGVSWAAANGIESGHGDGQFGPNDSMTREQLAVMLWRYAGSPTVEERELPFLDADQVSDSAMEALRWAVASGLMCGDGAGHLSPTGLTTRAQAAQLLKNFMENT